MLDGTGSSARSRSACSRPPARRRRPSSSSARSSSSRNSGLPPAAAGRRALLQPRRRADRVTGHQRHAEPLVADHDLSGRDAAARTQRDAVAGVQLPVEVGELRVRADGRPDRAQRVVLVQHRDPEHCEGGVAEELLHRAAVALQHPAQRLQVPADDVVERLRVEALPPAPWSRPGR